MFQKTHKPRQITRPHTHVSENPQGSNEEKDILEFQTHVECSRSNTEKHQVERKKKKE